jgi:hypothetical protein
MVLVKVISEQRIQKTESIPKAKTSSEPSRLSKAFSSERSIVWMIAEHYNPSDSIPYYSLNKKERPVKLE